MDRVFWCFQFFLFNIVLLNYAKGENATGNFTKYEESSFTKLKKPELAHRKWITQLMEEARSAFDIDPAADAQCRRDFNLYKLHLQNQSIWAVRST